jgi:Tol biopolymer transport system component
MIIRLFVLTFLLSVLPVSEHPSEKWMDFHPSLSPDGKHIAYYSYRGDHPDVFVTDLDTGTERNITRTETDWEIEPRWAPTGNRIVYSKGTSMADLQVTVHDLTANASITIGPGVNATWSPDGNSIAYMSKWELWVADADGKSKEKVANADSGMWSDPAWTSDGSHLVGLVQKEEGGSSSLLKLNLETGETSELLPSTIGSIGSPSFLNDETLVVSIQKGNIRPATYVIDLAKGNEGLESEQQLMSGGLAGFQYFPEARTGASNIYVESGEWSGSQFYIYAIPVDGTSKPVRVTGPRER